MMRRFLVPLLAVTALVGCTETVTENEGDAEAPNIPRASTMSLDLDLPTSSAARAALGEHQHRNTAIFYLAFLNTGMALAFGPPTLAFQAAISETPVQQSDGSWLWTYDWTWGQRDVQIQLQASLDTRDDEIDWELRITDDGHDPPLEDFVWFDGSSSTVEDSGFWLFYDADDVPTARGDGANVRLDWQGDGDDEASLTVTIVEAVGEQENTGDTLVYAVDGTARSVVWTDASEEDTGDIGWDAVAGDGSLRWPNYNGYERGCWDTIENNQVDILCEAPVIPSAATMSLDLEMPTSSAALTSGGHQHRNTAIFYLAFLNTGMALAFGPPTLAFQAAINETPVPQIDGSWLWTYTWTWGQREVEIQLQAWLDTDDDEIDWELRVSDNGHSPPLEDFVWFDGSSSLVEDQGFWLFYDADDATARGEGANVRLDWANGSEEASLTVTILQATGEEDNTGDTLAYAASGTGRSVVWTDASEENTGDIGWDAVAGDGSLRWPNYNGYERGCWDTIENDQVDIDCPTVARTMAGRPAGR